MMPSVGFEPMTPVFKRTKTVHALDCASFVTVVYKICAHYLRNFCLCLSSCKITGTSEWIVMKFDTGEFNKVHMENTVLVVKEQPCQTHEDPHAFHALLERKKLEKYLQRKMKHVYDILQIFFHKSLRYLSTLIKKGRTRHACDDVRSFLNLMYLRKTKE